MDSKYEDNMLSQIEKNLSNNINDNLFLTGKVFDSSRLTENTYLQEQEQASDSGVCDYPLVSNEHISDMTIPLSRAEYIKQAREACLRQLSNSRVYARPYELDYTDMDTSSPDIIADRKDEHWKPFSDNISKKGAGDDASPQELAAFRSLIIRTICAVIIFISIFIIDKFDFKIGSLTNSKIQEYITGNDTLKALEDIFVTWLK